MGRKWQRLGLILSVVIILLYTAKAENTTYPTANNNLSRLQAWRSAEYCLRNTSATCGQKYTLSDSGWLNVTHNDGPGFCSNGCAEHTKWVLTCLDQVMKDYWFANHANIKDIYDTIAIGCNSNQGFTGVSRVSDGYRINSITIVTAFAAVISLIMSY